MEILSASNISIEYLYAYVGRQSTDAIVIIRVETPPQALAILEQSGIRVLSAREVYGI